MKDKLIPKSKFPFVLGFTALLIALCAAGFSVYGISTLFAGASISAMVMSSSLEIGKLVGTTFLYRYWTKCTKLLKLYLVIAIIVLMIITSLGIFGYLSSAYQKSSVEYSVTQEKIVSLNTQKSYFSDKMLSSKKRIDELIKLRDSQDSRMSQVLTNEYISRNPIQLRQLQQQNVDMITDTDNNIKEENKKIQDSIDGVSKLDQQINDLKIGSASKKDVQTFKFVADAFNVSLDVVARWFIISIIFVFDPLAVCLILAYNVAVYKNEENSIASPKFIPESQPSQPNVEQIINPSNIITPNVESIPPAAVSPTQKNDHDDFFKRMFKMS